MSDTTYHDVAAVVLAAGAGTRFRSDLAKVLHRAAGRSLLRHVLGALAPLDLGQVVVVVGHQADDVRAEAESAGIDGLETVVQEEQLGTGHAVQVALPALRDGIRSVLVLPGDSPLIDGQTLAALLDAGGDAVAATMLTTELDDPTGYGRVERSHAGTVQRIVEHRDATAKQRAIREVNGGMYLFDRDLLAGVLPTLRADNDQGELYLTDVVGRFVNDGASVGAHVVAPDLVAGVNDRVQLADAAATLRRRHLEELMRAGVSVVDPATTYVDVDVVVGRDTVVMPGTILAGRTIVGERATVGPNSHLVDTEVADGASVVNSVCRDAKVGPDATVGPFTYLRPGARLERGAKTGAFVEVKASTVGEDSKVPHLSYVGDAEIGAGVNFSAGAITVNYDGSAKHRTVVEDGAFVGCDTMLVAPVTIGGGAFVAAGSTITDDVPPDALAIARSRQTVKDGWAATRRARDGA